MRMKMIMAGLSIAAAGAVAAQQERVCVRNMSGVTHVFAAEAGAAATRQLARLAPGETLCTQPGATGPGSSFVSVFEDEDALEGCSRLVTPGQVEDLIRYADFDRCAWGSNS